MYATKPFVLVLASVLVVSMSTASGEPMGTAFTYQGRVERGGSPVTDTCDFQFTLWEDATAWPQIGPTQTPIGVAVQDGLFTVDLDFDSDAFNGNARWLGMAVKCTPDPDFIPLDPRQELTPSPHALALPGLWTQQNSTSPNLIGGYYGNIITEDVLGATIGGGGSADFVDQRNVVHDNYGTVSGGANNVAGQIRMPVDTTTDAMYATVGGGQENTSASSYCTVGGGLGNWAGSC